MGPSQDRKESRLARQGVHEGLELPALLGTALRLRTRALVQEHVEAKGLYAIQGDGCV